MDSISRQPNTQVNVSIAATSGSGGAQASAGSAALGRTALTPNAAAQQSQQMLETYVRMAMEWTRMMGGSDPQNQALPLWGNYQHLIPGSQGNAGDLLSLSTPLRQNYAWMFGPAGANDSFQAMGAPLRQQYNALLNIPGMPPVPPMP
jgi:hypothetical protein